MLILLLKEVLLLTENPMVWSISNSVRKCGKKYFENYNILKTQPLYPESLLGDDVFTLT